jgi:hypothetical protein
MIPQQAMMKDTLSPHTPSPLPADADATVTGTDIVYLADLQPQPVERLWQHRLAAGTLAMLSGEPGSGKTWVALAIAAALTRGRDPFTGEKLKPATVLSASAEHSPPCAAPNSISAFVAPKTENQVPDGGLCRLRRMSTLRSTRQDAQINYLSTLSIFMKQTTYLATLPNFVEFREPCNIGLALGCWHGEPAEEIQGDAGARDFRGGGLSGTRDFRRDFRGQVAQPPSEMQFSSQSNDERT